MKMGSEVTGWNSSLSQSDGVCAVETPDPSSSTTTESTAGHSNNHVGYRWIHKQKIKLNPLCLSHTHTHTHTPKCCRLLVTQSEPPRQSASRNFDISHTLFFKIYILVKYIISQINHINTEQSHPRWSNKLKVSQATLQTLRSGIKTDQRSR